MTEPTHRRPPPYILDQPLSLLGDGVPLEKALTMETLRAGKRLSREDQKQPNPWIDWDRDRLVNGMLPSSVGTDHTETEQLRRVLVSVEAGMGKSKLLKYLRMSLPQRNARYWPVLIEIPKLNLLHSINELPALLMQRASLARGVQPQGMVEEQRLLFDIRVMLTQGRVIFLLDGLDHVDTDSVAMTLVRDLLHHQDWSGCGFVIAGRPYSMLRERDSWLNSGETWRVVRLEEFDVEQQRAFLGKTADGSEDRLGLVPREAWSVLNIPRVLEYLHFELTDAELRNLKTPSDVYWKALGRIVDRGLETAPGRCLLRPNDEPASESLRGTQREAAFDLLGAIAFQMVVDFSGLSDARPDAFEQVPARRLSDFKVSVRKRLMDANRKEREWQEIYRHDPSIFSTDFTRLAKMNATVEMNYGLFDSNQPLQFRDRSMQAWFAAYWLAKHAIDSEAVEFRSMIFQAGLEQTEAYYEINRYLSEMPSNARDDESWVRAAGVWYRPGDGTVAGTKRSTEMLFRSWRTMHELAGEPVFDWWDYSYEKLCEDEAKLKRGEPLPFQPSAGVPAAVRQQACKVLTTFKGEFQSILNGTHGETLAPQERAARQAAAKELTENFIPVKGGTFPMGSSRSTLSPELRRKFEGLIARHHRGEDPVELATEGWPRDWWPLGNREDQLWQQRIDEWANMIRGGMEAVARHPWYEDNEIPKEKEQAVAGFRLGAFPVLNEWFRLFVPGHGESAEWFAVEYKKRSETARDPVIYISWWDAWALAEWTRWSTETEVIRCRLPHEPEFEYVAKDRDHPDWDYWWGPDFDESDLAMCNANWRIKAGATRPPEEATRSFHGRLLRQDSQGFCDLLGNVWEWMANRYQREYSRKPNEGDRNEARVLRGGAWDCDPSVCRSAIRSGNSPGGRDSDSGLRLVCVVCVRTL